MRAEFYKEVADEKWNDWEWQIQNRITTVEQLEKVIPLTENEKKSIKKALKRFRMAITPYYASLIDINDANCPIRKQAVPTMAESIENPHDLEDPLGEEKDSVTKALVHRYPDRVLFTVTDLCGMYCRHCTRRRFTGQTDKPMPQSEIDASISYIEKHKEIRDVIISGGDPLTFNDDKILSIIARLRAIPHIEIIRIGTRTPVTLPQRITEKLAKELIKYHPIYVSTHFNNPKELTEESKQAISYFVDNGIPVANQSTLLRGVNDCPNTMKKLVHDLVKNRIRPYYIYQCDMSPGISHFRTRIAAGINIIESLQGHTSGMCIPTYVIDCPGGGGKIPILPTYLLTRKDGKVILRNYKMETFEYVEPAYDSKQCECKYCKKKTLKHETVN